MTDRPLLDDLVALTCDLVAIQSIAERPDQLQAAIDYVEAYARAVPRLRIHRAECAGKPSMVATLRATHRPAIMLNAHLDVVPGRPDQFQPVVRDGRIYGRATQDMKGAGAVLLRLMKDLAALNDPPDVGFMFVTDEEIGGYHGTEYLARQGWLCDLFIAGEPSDLQICYEQKGIFYLTIDIPGQPAHASRPWEGRSAFDALRNGLSALATRFPLPREATWSTTVVPTLVHGGDADNRLPTSIQVMCDVRHVPSETPEAIIAGVEQCFPGAEVRLERYGPPLATDPNHPHVQRLAEVISTVTGTPAQLYREHFASDARFYSALGIPAVCFGPAGAGLHSDEEWVDITSLEQMYRALWRFVGGQ